MIRVGQEPDGGKYSIDWLPVDQRQRTKVVDDCLGSADGNNRLHCCSTKSRDADFQVLCLGCLRPGLEVTSWTRNKMSVTVDSGTVVIGLAHLRLRESKHATEFRKWRLTFL